MTKPVRDAMDTAQQERRLEFDAPGSTVETALVRSAGSAIEREVQAAVAEEESMLDWLSRMERGAEFLKKRAELLMDARTYAIQATDPGDWLLTKDKAGNEKGMITGPGAAKVAPLLGINVRSIRPVDARGLFRPERIEHSNGTYSLRATFDAYCLVTGQQLVAQEAERRSDEEFTGRTVNAKGDFDFKGGGTLEADLRSSVLTLCVTKAVRLLGGMVRVPRAELDRAWAVSGIKSTATCQFGSGYGNAAERGAQRAAAAGGATASEGDATALWNAIVARVGGDQDAAKQLLKECTSFTKQDGGLFPGYDSIQRVTNPRMVAAAWKALHNHATFGDDAMESREPGSEG